MGSVQSQYPVQRVIADPRCHHRRVETELAGVQAGSLTATKLINQHSEVRDE